MAASHTLLNGATWVLLSATLLALIFPIRIAVPAFVMFMTILSLNLIADRLRKFADARSSSL